MSYRRDECSHCLGNMRFGVEGEGVLGAERFRLWAPPLFFWRRVLDSLLLFALWWERALFFPPILVAFVFATLDVC